jgi:hypothetical protein
MIPHRLRLRGLVSVILLLAFMPCLQAQQDDGAAFAAKKKDGEPGSLKQKTLDVEKMKGERNKILARIKEIDAIITPVREKIVVEVVGLDVEEYRALKMQSDNAGIGSKYFPALRKIYTTDMAGAGLYFDEAYEALSRGKLWVGREEKLIDEDIQLQTSVEAEITEAMSALPNGAGLLQLMAEKEELLGRLKASSPLLNYLTERRRWWDAYPDYIDTLKGDHPATTPAP